MLIDAKPRDPRLGRLVTHVAWGLKLFALSFSSLLLFYLVVGNLFLRLGGLKRLASMDPSTFTMDHGSIWTYWPGRAWAKGLQLTGQDSSIQWMVRLDDATVHVELGELFQQRFHATHVRGDGVVWRLRHRLSSGEADHPIARALPPIPGFADPPMLPIEAPDADPTHQDYDLWTAHLEDIDVDVQEIWIESYRYTGDARLRSEDFFFKPLRRVQLEPTGLEFRSGDLQIGEHAALTGMEGKLGAVLDAFDPRAGGGGLLRALIAKVALHAQVPALDFVNHHVDPRKLDLRDGSGALDLDLAITRGAVSPGSTARLATENLDLEHEKFTANLAAEVTLRFDAEARGELAARVERAALRWPGNEAPVAVAENARLSLEVPSDLIAPWVPEVYSLDLPSVRVSNLAHILPPGAPRDIRLQGGSALLRAHLEARAGAPGRGSLHADLWSAAVRWKDIAVEGSIGLDLQIDTLDLAERTAALRGKLGAGKVSVRHGETTWRDWWASVSLERVQASAGKTMDLRGEARVKMRDARPILGVMAGMESIPLWTTEMFPLNGLEVDVNLTKKGPGLAIGLQAVSGAQSVTGLLKQQGEEEQRGAFLAKAGPLSAGISLGESGGVTLAAGEDWLKEQLAALRNDVARN